MNWIRTLLEREAVLGVGVVVAVANLAAAFGLELTAEQLAGINGLLVAVGSVLARRYVWSDATHSETVQTVRTLERATRSET